MTNEAVIDHSQLALFSADTDKIKDYVFESAKLPEIRGASMTLDSLNWGCDEKGRRQYLQLIPTTIGDLFSNKGLSTKRWPDGNLVYAGGGSLVALVPIALAEDLRREIEALYPHETDTATITCVWQPVTSPTALESDFHRLMDTQTLLLRRRKEERKSIPFIEALPHQRRCESCGARPATDFREWPSERWLCAACEKKAARGGKKHWAKRFEERLQDGLPGVSLTRYLGGALDLDAVEPALDLSEIAACGDGRTIGLIYADGDSVGRWIEDSSSVREYQLKSQALTLLLPELAYTALSRYLHASPVERQASEATEPTFIHPFELITIGGDDLLLIVPGEVALPIAMEIGQRFAQQCARQLQAWQSQFRWQSPKRLPTMSAGVVIAHQDNPIRYLRTLVEQLLKSAKKGARKSPDESAEGAIDFLVLKSQSMLWSELSDLRHQVYEFGYPSVFPQGYVELIHRPYMLSEMEQLLSQARLLRDVHFPLSQMQSIRRVLRESQRVGRTWPTLWYSYQKARMQRVGRIMRFIDQAWGMLDANSASPPPWKYLEEKRGKPYYAAVWEDLHEVRQLLPKLEDEPPDVQDRCRALLRECERNSGQEGLYAS